MCVKSKRVDVENFNASLKKMFWNRKLFTAGHCTVGTNQFADQVVLWEQGVDLLPLWELGLSML